MILVFGGIRQLGRELARAAVARGSALVSLVRSKADITDYSAIVGALKQYKPAIVINAAAYAKVDLAETEIEKARVDNAIGPANLAEACAEARLRPTSANDLASAILRIVPFLLSREDIWGIFHFAGAGATTRHGFAKRIVAAQAPSTGHPPRVTTISRADYPRAAPRPANSEFDCSLFVKVFGFGARSWTEETDAVTRAVVANSGRTHVA